MRIVTSIFSIIAFVCISNVSAFAPANTGIVGSFKSQTGPVISSSKKESRVALNERQWNFNETGRSPWGMKKNAEIWNGRMAQMGFTIVLLQELVTGQGVIKGIQEGNPFNLAMLGFAGVSIVGLTAWLAIQGTEQYVDPNTLDE